MAETEIIALLAETGPLAGAELAERTCMEVLPLWQTCKESPAICLETVGGRFLRLDRNVKGYARLSPSIRREFLTYTLLGLESQREILMEKAETLSREIKQISRDKLALAEESVASVVESLPEREIILEKVCFVIAGDVAYEMSHTVPRPEKSTGEMVRGSDLDIIVVAEDDVNAEVIRSLDRSIYRKKRFLIAHPQYREEIDYLIKPISRVREQLEFATFESMIACKILHEGKLLYASPAVFRTVKDLVAEHGIPQQLMNLERQAAANRELAEARLLDLGAEGYKSDSYNLFYTQEEGDEIY